MPFAPAAVLGAWALVAALAGATVAVLWVLLLVVAVGLQIGTLARKYRR